MAEFQRVVKDYKRMCDTYKLCGDCPIRTVNKDAMCSTWIIRNPEEAERIVMQWAKENPLMTNRMKFKEVFGFEFTDRVAESQYHREWLNAEYKGGKDEQH